MVFTVWVHEKNEFLWFCHRFQEIIILSRQFHSILFFFRSMPINIHLGKPKPQWINVWKLCSRIGPFELIFNLHIERNQTKPVCFLKKIYSIKKKMRKLMFKIWSSIIMVKSLKFSHLFLDQIDFFSRKRTVSVWCFSVCGFNMRSNGPILEPKGTPGFIRSSFKSGAFHV